MSDLDEILVSRIRAGEQECFETLVSRYQGKIFAFIFRTVGSREEATDLTQEVFVQVYRSLGQFRGEAKFSTWIYRIAANKTLDFLRRNKQTKHCVSVAAIEAGAALGQVSEANPEDIYLREEKIRRLRRMIAGLPDKYRVVLHLFHYDDLSYQQIAEVLEIPVKTVATRLYRAKLLLKENLGGETDGVS